MLTESELQEKVQKFVDREVIYCVSSLVYELGQKEGIALYDEFPDLYQGAPTYGEWECPECFHTWSGEPEEGKCPECNEVLDSDETAQFEPTEHDEIFEHWIVSEFLANKLEAKGESIERDFFGLTVWGRSCTGQSIMLDSVVREIWKESQA
jgi:hypothetical protein